MFMWLPGVTEIVVMVVSIVGVAAFFFVIVRLAINASGPLWRVRGARCGSQPAGQVRCPDQGCQHLNPPFAKFCCRCGRPLTSTPSPVANGTSP